MSAAQHTPGRVCDACEGFCLQAADRHVDAGVELSLRIGQRVRHQDHDGMRVTGRVRGLSVDFERVLQVDIVLDAPIVIPALSADDREISIWHQHVPAHELTPFDDRDELVAELLSALREALDAVKTFHGPDCWDIYEANAPEMKRWRAAIAKATGSAA